MSLTISKETLKSDLKQDLINFRDSMQSDEDSDVVIEQFCEFLAERIHQYVTSAIVVVPGNPNNGTLI